MRWVNEITETRHLLSSSHRCGWSLHGVWRLAGEKTHGHTHVRSVKDAVEGVGNAEMRGLSGAGAGRATASAWAPQRAGSETKASLQVPEEDGEPREEGQPV